MYEHKVLKTRWKEVDKSLASFYLKNNKLNKKMQDKIQDVLNGIKIEYSDLFTYAKISYIALLHRRIQELKENGNLKGYTGYLLNNLYNKNKLKNNEVIKGLILVEYYKMTTERDEIENILFKEVAETSYIQGQKEAIKITKNKKLFDLPTALLLSVFTIPTYNGYKWADYKDGNIVFEASTLVNVVYEKMQRQEDLSVDDLDLQKVFNKQQNTYLSKKKPDKIDKDKYSNPFFGVLDNQVELLTNQIALEGMKKQGVEKVQFVAVIDEKTTDMCESLNGQIFYINDWNTYSRYSKADDRNVIYKTFGLEVGANLPPINNNFHYCRSTIIPYR